MTTEVTDPSERTPDLARTSPSEPPQDTSLDADLRKILGESTRDGYTFMIPYEILVKRLKAYNSSLLSQQRAKLFEQIRNEVIGEDEPLVKADDMQKRSLEIRRNELRAEQREALNRLEKNNG